MHLGDVRIVTGASVGCVAEGRFELETPHYPDGKPVQLAGAQISVFMGSGFGAQFHLSELVEGPHGVFSRASQDSRLGLHIPAAVDFEQLLFGMAWSPDPDRPRYLEWAKLFVDSSFGWVSGQIPSLRLEISLSEAGFGISLSGEVGPLKTFGGLSKPDAPVPELSDSRLRADIVIPWAFLIVQGSMLASKRNAFRPPAKRSDASFDFRRPGLSGVAFDGEIGDPFFQGRFVVQGAIGRPCVRARIDGKSLELRPCGEPRLGADGFAVRSPSDPAITFTLTLPALGYDAWSKILGGETSGRLELKGDGIGFLTEATWMRTVAGRHTIAACSIDLALGDDELVLKIEGEVGQLLQHGGPPLPPKLGPRFETTVRIPVAFLAARNIDLLAWGLREKLALDAGRVP